MSDLYYKDSVNILGVSLDELEDFINPSAQPQPEGSNQVMAKIDKACTIPDVLNNNDIEQIGEYCVNMIAELQE